MRDGTTQKRPCGGRNVFTYGTLMFADVLFRVTGRQFSSSKAEIENYARYRVKEAVYPGLGERPGCVTGGTLYFDIDVRSMRLLDCFEGETYSRRTIVARTMGGDRHTAEVYLTAPEYHHALDADAWDPEVFAAKHLESYLKHCRKFYKRHKYQFKSVA